MNERDSKTGLRPSHQAHTRVSTCLVLVALMLTGASSAYADEVSDLGSFPTIVNPQITDVLTSVPVQVLPDSPTLIIGDEFLNTAQALAPAYNAAAEAVAQSITLDAAQVRFLLDDGVSANQARRETIRELLAIGEDLADCGERCVLNIHVHLAPGMSTADQADAIAAVTAAVDLMSDAGIQVDGIGWLIPDGDAGDNPDANPGDDALPVTGQRVTSIDVLLQRDLDGNAATQEGRNADGCPLRAYANCSYTNLDGLDLTDKDLTGIDLTGASLRGVNLTRAKLSSANFSDADISETKFHRADMRGAIFRNASARTADFAGANLQRANFFGADLQAQSFAASADLSGATWTNGVVCRMKSIGTCWQPN